MSDEAASLKDRDRFRFADHPWLSLATFLLVSVFVLILTATITFRVLALPEASPLARMAHSAVAHVITLFVLVPFVLRLPKGKRSFTEYVDDIGLARTRPLARLVLLALSCYVILALCQAAGSVVYRLSEGLSVDLTFLRRIFDVSGDLPPRSMSPIVSLPSVFEEVGFRGVIVTVFLSRYSRRRSITVSAAGFAVLHVLNILSGREAAWVMGQLVWSFCMGIFYGYLFIKTGSLIPPMLVHYLGNVFIGSLTSYIQELAPVAVQAVYGVVFSFGVVPVVLMILWIGFFARKWPFPHELEPSGLEKHERVAA